MYLGQPDRPVLEDVARDFHMSPTTLRRRLEAEFTSYHGIKDEARRDAAIHHLCSTDTSVGEIGALVGFEEPVLSPGPQGLERGPARGVSATGNFGYHCVQVPTARRSSERSAP